MILKEDLDPRTILGITFNFILFGFIINKPLPSHVLFFISNLYFWTLLYKTNSFYKKKIKTI